VKQGEFSNPAITGPATDHLYYRCRGGSLCHGFYKLSSTNARGIGGLNEASNGTRQTQRLSCPIKRFRLQATWSSAEACRASPISTLASLLATHDVGN
jgi:hypothetical protein